MAVLSDLLAFQAPGDAAHTTASLGLFLPRPSPSVLPAGVATLHHALCGCPQAAWSPGPRPAAVLDTLVQRCHAMYAHQILGPNRRLRIAYALPHHNITGGMKCLVEHIRLLRARGHYVIAVHRSATAASAMPPWTSVRPDADVLCGLHQRLTDVWDVSSIDVVVVGIFHQVRGSCRQGSCTTAAYGEAACVR
jgi:hypothetical protein